MRTVTCLWSDLSRTDCMFSFFRLFVPLQILLNMVSACARVNNQPSSVTREQCPASTTSALLYTDSSFMSSSNFYGEVAPTSNCVTCASGQSNYYPDSMEAVIMASSEKAIAGVNCQNFCICQADGTCYQRNSPDTSIVLYPYCDAGVCSVYALVLGNQNTDGIVSTDGTRTITSASQVDPTTARSYPVTQDDLYPKITSASCNGCDFAKSCPT